MSARELVVFSHLPWDFVWQRPQHLVSRLARDRDTWFVEEPRVAGVTAPRLRVERADPVTRVWLDVPGPDRPIGFADPGAAQYPAAVAELFDGDGAGRIAWLYSPLALPCAAGVPHELLVFDVMDDLSAFKGASPAMRAAEQRALSRADLVFTGGRSIDAGVRGRSEAPVHLFPSGVEPQHFERARALRRPHARPVAGYVGVVDERIDLELLAELASRLPDWEIELVGPVFKIAPGDLPQAPNLHPRGMQPYARLPAILAGFDVAIMPFALNEATRSISPTKTLEFLAAGLPVVSTAVPDVVAEFGEVVDVQDDAEGFAAACRALRHHDLAARDALLAPLMHERRWDTIAARMERLIERSALDRELERELDAAPERAS